MSGEAEQPNPEFDQEAAFTGSAEPDDREEILDALLEQTQHELREQGVLNRLVEHVRQERLPSRFSLENLHELVRFVLSGSRLSALPVDSEECITWVSHSIYDDPVANERASELWTQIIDKLQGDQ